MEYVLVMSMKISTIIAKFASGVDHNYGNINYEKGEAKALAEIKKAVMEVIGVDDSLDNKPIMPEPVREVRNILREEQRERLEELLEEGVE